MTNIENYFSKSMELISFNFELKEVLIEIRYGIYDFIIGNKHFTFEPILCESCISSVIIITE